MGESARKVHSAQAFVPGVEPSARCASQCPFFDFFKKGMQELLAGGGAAFREYITHGIMCSVDVYLHPAARAELASLPTPERGRSQWRAFHRQVGAAMVVATIGPDAGVDAHGFARAVKVAQQRLSALEGVE